MYGSQSERRESHSKKKLTLFELIQYLASFAQASARERSDGLVSVFQRYDHGTALRFARELRVLREYVRGDVDVIHDIARSFELYEEIFAVPKS